MRKVRSGTDEFAKLMEQLLFRRQSVFDEYRATADEQIAHYREGGEDYLLRQTRELDGVDLKPEELWVSPGLIKAAHKGLRSEVREAVEKAKERIERFQEDLKLSAVQSQEESGIFWGTCVRPLDRVGIYVPGGQSHFFLTLLFCAVPARMAGVNEIIIASPPRKKWGTPYVDPLILYAAKILDISKILVAGGPAALAALAFGTKNSQPVQKIVGSGSKRTIVAKHRLSGIAGTEGLFGPSETAFLCDKSSEPSFVAADIISRADRDSEASIYVFHTDEKWIDHLVEQLAAGVSAMKDATSRKAVQDCLESNCHFFIVKNFNEAISLANQISPGYLCLPIDRASDYVDQIQSCGNLLLGPYCPAGASDLIGGAAGLISTLGGSQFSVSMSPASFVRRFPYIEVSQEALDRTRQSSGLLAGEESALSLQRSMDIRFQK